ncbi:glycosyltransferase family 2 protein [Nocardioides limicola]|uniref:glycosyltransferase family 2 protein n=1 Tax=Nocardioides limicola TaxID=2803368 RepID=UPI00193B69B0|nr:glycosyltransferase family 2 protein [Nocardioides sp. DJM-14]
MSLPSVACVLVSHDGARWLPQVLAGLQAQEIAPTHLVAVDTGSKDDSRELLAAALRVGPWDGHLDPAPSSTSFPAAVRRALDHLASRGVAPEWIWLLHDDSAPAPSALLELLEAALQRDADICGPKLREWPSLRRLLEVGVTISGTGRRETGLERGEYDQGQHDDIREVLAVNTAGMLVRREVLERLGGFDDELPIFGNDLDFGWRAAASGHRCVVAPAAVVFHAEAAHRGLRRTPLTGRHTRYAERRAALYTLLVNCRPQMLPLLWLRLIAGTVLRMLGLLLTRQVGFALDELAALLSLYTHPRQIHRARRARRALHTEESRAPRLLAPWWLPYRHGLDALGDLAAAVSNQAQDVAERRRLERIATEGGARVAVRGKTPEDDELAEETGWLPRFLTSPVAWLVTVFVVLVLVGARDAWDGVSGAGALSPVPDGVAAWWQLHLSSTHPLGVGTELPAPGYVPILALLGTAFLGNAELAVAALMIGAIPLAALGAWRFFSIIGRLLDHRGAPRWVLGWGAVTWALVPVASGAWGSGRLGTVVVAAVLPWLAAAALGLADPALDRRRRAGWRVGLLLALMAAFVPGTWLLAVLMTLVVGLVGWRTERLGSWRQWRPVAVALGTPVLLLLPWWLPLLANGAPGGLVLEAGRVPSTEVGAWGLIAGRFADAGAPAALGFALALVALLALVPASTRVWVGICWAVAAVAGLAVALLGRLSVDIAGGSSHASLAPSLLLLQAAFITAVLIAGQGASGRVPRPDPPARRRFLLPVAAVAALLPMVTLGWFAVTAGSPAPATASPVPAYMTQSARADVTHGLLLLRGSVEEGLSWTVHRGDGTTLGEDEILALTPPDDGFNAVLRTMVAEPSPELVDALAEQGIVYLLMPAPADGRVAAVLDATGGLVHASTEDRRTRAWRVEPEPAADSVVRETARWRTLLVILQALALLVVLVQCGPARPDPEEAR